MADRITLMFHDVLDDKFPHSGFDRPGALQYTIDAKRFEELVKFCVKSSADVVFSFDDGGSSFYNVIAPILEKYDKRGVFFISTGYIGTERFLTQEQIKELYHRGHIIASHSNSHPQNISKLKFNEIVDEWSKSKMILEEIVGECISQASIPGGAISTKVLKGLKQAGYDIVYTSIPTNKTDSFDGISVVGRYTITNHSDITYLKKLLYNSSYRRKLIIKYKALRLMKLILGSNYNKLKQIILSHK